MARIAYMILGILYEADGPRIQGFEGSSPWAFNFRKPFTSGGQPIQLDRAAARLTAVYDPLESKSEPWAR